MSNRNDNLAVLCFECHNKTQLVGGFDRKRNPQEVITYREDWHERVTQRRDRADEIASLRMSGVGDIEALSGGSTATEVESWLLVPADESLVAYVNSLPEVLALSYERAQPMWDSGVTAKMVKSFYDIIDVLVQVLVRLSMLFPPEHFGDKPASEYFSDFVSTRFVWRRALAEPEGVATGGTIVGVLAAEKSYLTWSELWKKWFSPYSLSEKASVSRSGRVTGSREK